jgi:ketosteroid isomerase-like protein
MIEGKERSAEEIALAWLAEMQACVGAVDFARCRAIFAEEVVGFGTRARVAIGLDALERDQWRHIWGKIRNFTFLTDEMHCSCAGEEGVWLACPWTSQVPAAGGQWGHRPGRITAVLERRDGRWLAVHTHHSLVPESSSEAAPPPRQFTRNG